MEDHCIVYPYLSTSPLSKRVIVQNYESHVNSNPGIPVIPVSIRGEPWLPDTVFVDTWLDPCIRSIYKTSSILFYMDYLLLAYLRSSYVQPSGFYFFADWDTYSNGVSVLDFFGSDLETDVLGAPIHLCCGKFSNFWCGDWCGCTDEVSVFDNISVLGFSRKAAQPLAITDPDSVCPGMKLAHGSVRIPTVTRHLGLRVSGVRGAVPVKASYNFSSIPSIYRCVRTPTLDDYHEYV